MSQNTYAVIGSNCFTGSHIVDALLENPSSAAVGLSRSPEKNPVFLPYKRRISERFQFHQVDLFHQSDKLLSLLDEIRPAYIINVAALSEVALSNYQPVEYFQTNTLGVVKLCNELRTRPYLKRYIHISSAEVYGSCPVPLTEAAPLNPSTPYAVSKAGADLYLLSLHRNFGFPVILVRSTNVYGQHQQLYKIIPRTIICLKQARKIELHGGGKAVKSWVHIRDVARGILLAAEKGRTGEIYHFSDENVLSIAELVQRICDMTGCDFETAARTVEERLGQDAKYLLDYSKARRDFGWSPKVSLKQGLQEVMDWLEENWQAIIQEPLQYVHQT